MEAIHDEVHVWNARLSAVSEQFGACLQVLSQDELERAGSFRQQKDRQRFILARGILRMLLARYTGRTPASFRFVEGRFGKPELRDNPARLRFNLSHSGDQVMYAFAQDREVGVDVEAEDPDLEWVEIARSFFSPLEWNALARLDRESGRHAFMTLWSRKEALHKAIGAGFSLPADKVPLPLGQASIQVSAQTLSGDDALWTIRQLETGSGYHAALAVQGEMDTVRCHLVNASAWVRAEVTTGLPAPADRGS